MFQVLCFRILGVGLRVYGLRFKIKEQGFGVKGLGFRV